MSRGVHTKPNAGETQTWLTPPELIQLLGPFDLDPCCPRWMPWRTASVMISKQTLAYPVEWPTLYGDGFTHEWSGCVWLNPPYSTAECDRWLGKLASHGDGIALIAARTETEWFHRHVWKKATALLFRRNRIHFHRPDGTRARGNAGHGSVIVAYGRACASRLFMADIEGEFIDFRL